MNENNILHSVIVLGNFTKKDGKTENPIAKLYNHFGTFPNFIFLITLVYSLKWYYLVTNFSPCRT